MTVLVCGGRNHNVRPERFDEVLMNDDIEMVINGGASGIDECARNWALQRSIHCATVPAMWERGKRAGPERNSAMLKLKPDLVVAFSGGNGTANMINQAENAGVEVRRV
jgi:hypothetical protein